MKSKKGETDKKDYVYIFDDDGHSDLIVTSSKKKLTKKELIARWNKGKKAKKSKH